MKKYVFTIKDDVCIVNGKDVEATELLAKMRLWGEVEDYDRAISAVKAEYQDTVDNLTTQLTAIKDQELTADEMRVLYAYREAKSAVVAQYVDEAEAYKSELVAMKGDFERKVSMLKAVLGD